MILDALKLLSVTLSIILLLIRPTLGDRSNHNISIGLATINWPLDSTGTEPIERELNTTQLLLNRFQYLFQEIGSKTGNSSDANEQQSILETRKFEQKTTPQTNPEEMNARNYFRILNRVFSRVDLPDVYKGSRSRGGHCGQHIGCVEELPNFPSLLKKANVSSSFTVYTRDNFKTGRKILFEPIVHHQLQDTSADLGANTSASDMPQRKLLADNSNRRQTAISWRSAARIIHSQEFPFDLASLEQSGFNSSLNTRIIVGGYFAKEDEEWIDEVVRQWSLLETSSNIIKVSWADANRGLYHTAAYNSRIVARQLTLFLYYLDQLFDINLDRFHLVGHSLGAHIAGYVGADNGGRIARITGLDPAGPIFVELNASMRLDPSDAKFVDVLHTNGGTITKGALGLSTPSGHVDYYCNGGSIQPGCYFSSVTKSIMDPVERVACSHRRSYRYFIEATKLAINDNLISARVANAEPLKPTLAQLPKAFLFEAKQDDLVRLTQPEIVFLANGLARRESKELVPLKRRLEFHLLNPQFPTGKRGLYFFKTRSEAPFFASKQYAITLRTDARVKRKIALMAKIDQTLVAEAELDEIPGVYTLAFAPNDQRLLNMSDEIRVPQLSLMWKHRSFNLLLNQQNELRLSAIELSQLDADDDDDDVEYPVKLDGSENGNERAASNVSNRTPIIRYSTSQSLLSSGVLKSGFGGGGGELALTRNQWHKLDGRMTRLQ